LFNDPDNIANDEPEELRVSLKIGKTSNQLTGQKMVQHANPVRRYEFLGEPSPTKAANPPYGKKKA